MIKLTWYGNASVRIDASGTGIVIDPYITRNPEMPKLELENIPDVSGILVTHGHFDHAENLPYFSEQIRVKIFLPPEIAANLKKNQGMNDECFVIPESSKSLGIGSVNITMLRGRHIRFDIRLIVKTLFRSLCSPVRLFRIAKAPFPEGRTVTWLVEGKGFRLLHLGSLGLDPGEEYPEDVDILSLPLQGHSRIHEMAFAIIEKLMPGNVFLHHFDDAFPPISSTIDPAPLVKMLDRIHPEINVLVPEYGIPVEINNYSR